MNEDFIKFEADKRKENKTMLEQLKTVERLKAVLKENGIKQGWVAEKIGVNKVDMSRFVNGKAALSNPKHEKLLEWLKIYE